MFCVIKAFIIIISITVIITIIVTIIIMMILIILVTIRITTTHTVRSLPTTQYTCIYIVPDDNRLYSREI